VEDLRHSFDEWIATGMDKPTQMKGLLSKLLCCSDQHAGMPAFTCDELGMRRGSTYGMAAQHIAAPIERGEDPSAGVKAKRAARVQVIMRLILRRPPERREREFQASCGGSSFVSWMMGYRKVRPQGLTFQHF